MMKTLLLTLLLTATAATLSAQDATVKATTMLLPDGSRTDSQINYAENTLEEKTYNSGGTLTRHVTYQLDASRQPASGVLYSPDGAVLYHFTFKRDPSGRIAEENNLASDGTLLRRMVYQYNSRGEITRLDAFDANGNAISTQQAINRPEKLAIQPATAGQLRPVEPTQHRQQQLSRQVRPAREATQVRRAEPVRRAQPVHPDATRQAAEAAQPQVNTRPDGPRVQHQGWEVVPK